MRRVWVWLEEVMIEVGEMLLEFGRFLFPQP
jgi:hypothetical protein